MTDENRPSRIINPIHDREGKIKAYVVTSPAHGSRRANVAVFYSRHPRFGILETEHTRQKSQKVGSRQE